MDDVTAPLRRHCLEKVGVKYYPDHDMYGIMDGFLDTFARFETGGPAPILTIRCDPGLCERLAADHPAIRASGRGKAGPASTVVWTDVVLDGTVPPEVLRELIDRSYQTLHDGLKELPRLQVALLARGLSPEAMLSELITFHGMDDHREEIEGLARPGFLLRTRKSEEGALPPPGRTKIGGEPDLPEGVEWPVHDDGKPLAFLAQVNLLDLPEGHDRGGLPGRGVLSFFSAWGWQDEDDADPKPPGGEPGPDWTLILFHAEGTPLHRRPTPEGVNRFPDAEVEAIVPITCFPSDHEEPAVAELGWDQETYFRYSDVADAYVELVNQRLGWPARNLLLGYADIQQFSEDEVVERDLRLLLQVASDPNAAMCWGDDGCLYIWADPEALARGDFTKVYTAHQGG